MSSLRLKVTLTTDIKDAYYPDMARIFILAFDPSWIGERLNPPEKRLSLEKRIGASPIFRPSPAAAHFKLTHRHHLWSTI